MSTPSKTPSSPTEAEVNAPARVCAVVVTFNRHAMLRECLTALEGQSRTVDQILVVDNASTDETVQMVRAEFPRVELLALATNQGGAGGFHEGMKWARDRTFDWMWLMDDDGVPLPDCLETLLNSNEPSDVARVLVPLQKNKLGFKYGVCQWDGNAREVTDAVVAGDLPLEGAYLFAFVGPLIPRTLVEKVGLPRANFFIYFDDWEYALRLHKVKAPVRIVPDALFLHDIGGQARHSKLLWYRSIRVTPAPWKLYYGARNAVWTLAHGRRPRRELHRYLSYHVRWMLGDIVYEADRWQRVSMRLKGILDGLRNRMGKRVAPGGTSSGSEKKRP
jgi:rhamnopyranosyl-N-acetylglucosaminyl-diphospho-decaprenol beta-1,3/1,4-galactofuranosyltransferase